MDKRAIAGLGLLLVLALAPVGARAQDDSREVTVGRSSFTAVTVGTTAVQMDNSARKVNSRSAIAVLNMSTSAIVYCSTESSVNTANGWAVFPRESYTFTLPDAVSLYCISDTADTDVRMAQTG